MPEFDTKFFFLCDTSEYFETKVTGITGRIYVVKWSSFGHKSEHQFDYSCSCQGYKFYGQCRHIEQVKKSGKHCKWDQFTDGGEVVKNEKGFFCPKCGAPAHPKAYAV